MNGYLEHLEVMGLVEQHQGYKREGRIVASLLVTVDALVSSLIVTWEVI